MKVAIVVLTVLIVGSNTENFLQNTLDSIIATTQAQALLNSLLNEINPITIATIQNITQQAQNATQTFQTSLVSAVTDAQGQLNASAATELAAEVAQSIADLTTNTTAFLTQNSALFNGLSDQIVSNVTPAIQELGSRILSGNLSLQCFISNVQLIEGKIGDLVNATQSKLDDVVSKFEGAVANDIKDFQVIYNTLLNDFASGNTDSVSWKFLEMFHFLIISLILLQAIHNNSPSSPQTIHLWSIKYGSRFYI